MENLIRKAIKYSLCAFFIVLLVVNSAFTESWREGKITFWSFDKKFDECVYIMNADGSGVTKLMEGTIPNLFGVFSLSPDCRKVAFKMGDMDVGDIAVFEIDSGRLINLTDGKPGHCSDPRWSPDGKKIVFFSYEKPNYQIYTMNSDGTNIRMIGEGSDPDWSPDGRRIVFVKNKMDIYTMDVSGGKLKNITEGQLNLKFLFSSRWSPDGRQILFSGYTFDNDTHIYTIDLDGNNLKLLIKEELHRDISGHCCWSPDGKKIAISAKIEPDDNFHIWIMNLDGSNLERLTNNDREEWLIDWRNPAFSIEINQLLKTTWGEIKTQQK